jgi:alginate O-acetyltransferase complex protein AlgI
MLFNSFAFIFVFFPVTLIGFYLIEKQGHHRVAIAYLVGASLFFYAWWNISYLMIFLVSILFNYAVGVSLGSRPRKPVLFFGIIGNIGLLSYYKYANFFVDNINILLKGDFFLDQIFLPLAISFFTFQQIAYLVDAYRGETHEYSFLHYCLFVTFFPQLIAGPIVHHREMLSQFAKDAVYKLRSENLAVGFTIFSIGLFQKVVLADGVAIYSTSVFNAAEEGVFLTLYEAWGGALAFSLQIYFDFAAYSSMAIGLGRMFGIRLPLNFNSPYKSTSIIDFWRRWHMTLSRFLRDYLYIPLGGGRKGRMRRLINLMLTMLLGGFWHGAGWTFVLWGVLHGIFLMLNHLWRYFCGKTESTVRKKVVVTGVIAWALTMLAVVAAWVPFRAETIKGAGNLLAGMVGLHGSSFLDAVLVPEGMFHNRVFPNPRYGIIWLLGLGLIAVLAPNIQQVLRRYRPAFETYKGELPSLRYEWMEWRPTILWALFTSTIFISAILGLNTVSEFLYFQF